MSPNQSLEALHNNRCQCYWAIIVQATDDSLLLEWDYCSRLQAEWYSGLGQGLVKDHSKDPSQLIRAFSLVFY